MIDLMYPFQLQGLDKQIRDNFLRIKQSLDNSALRGDITLTGTLTVTGAVAFQSTLVVTGITTLNNSVDINGSVDMSSTLTVHNHGYFYGADISNPANVTCGNLYIGAATGGSLLIGQVGYYTPAGAPRLNFTGTYIYTSNHSIGINVTAPVAKLEILDASIAQLRLTNTLAMDYAIFTVDGNGRLDISTIDGGGNAGHITFWPDGNVGIKTFTPTVTLDVVGSIAATGSGSYGVNFFVGGNTHLGSTTVAAQNLLTLTKTTGAQSAPGIDFFGTLTDTGAVFNQGRIYGKFYDTAGPYTKGMVIIAYPTGANTFTDCLCVRDGKIGIGTTNPSQIIHALTSGTDIQFWIESGAGRISGFEVNDSTSYINFISSHSAGTDYDMAFIFGTTTKMVLKTTGALIINATALTSEYILDVNGAVYGRADAKFGSNNTLCVDNTNFRVGIYQTTPAKRFEIGYGNMKFTPVTNATACVCALAGLGAGNIENGAHRYQITFVSDEGETAPGTWSNTTTVVDKTTNGKIALTGIPVSSAPNVTARKIYRTRVASTGYVFLVDTIGDNTTTIYTDNKADADLTTAGYRRENTTGGIIYIGSLNAMMCGVYNTWLGLGALGALTTGDSNTAIGSSALTKCTTGSTNTAIGYVALSALTEGNDNTAIGYNSLGIVTTGAGNTAIGGSTLSNQLGAGNATAVGANCCQVNTAAATTAFGQACLRYNTSGTGNTAMGFQAGRYTVTGSNNTLMGYNAGQGVSTNSYSGNTIMGYQAGNTLTTGGSNLLLGYQCGDNLTTGTNNIIIGYDLDASAEGVTYELNIGGLIKGDVSGTPKFSVFGVTTIVRQNHIIDADGSLADITTKFNTLLGYLENYGFLKTS